MDIQQLVFKIAQAAPGFLLAIVIHEYAHGRVAKMFGDDTAEREGRLSMNPAVHIDPMGTIAWPIISILLGGAVFGWAKPVPISIRNFSDTRKAVFWVSFAGPLSNFILGTLSALDFTLCYIFIPQNFSFYATILQMLQYSVFINFLLGGFNIIPFPPLDGSRMLASFLKGEALRKYEELARYTPYVMFGIIGLSLAGIPTIHYVIEPFISFGQALPRFFLEIFI